jgi:energy-coupling factor transporter ATP-binding protein EcfA2
MISSISIENFRCFKHLEVNDLGKINILVGKNGSGKSSLLEAVVLTGHPPQLVFDLRNIRGLAQTWGNPMTWGNQITRATYESFWKDLFWKFDQKNPIKITLKGDENNGRSMTVSYNPQRQTEFISAGKAENGNPSGVSSSISAPVSFETTYFDGETMNKYSVTPVIQSGGGISFNQQGEPRPPITAYSPATGVPASNVNADQFSKLVIKGRKGKIVTALKKVFPKIEDLITASPVGANEIYCHIPSEFSEYVHIGLISHGISRLLANLLLIASHENGVVVIDEIETGLHYSILPQAWEAICEFSETFNVQIIASTHSEECLRAIVPFVKENPEKFRLLRAEVGRNSEHTVDIFKGENFEAALESGIEIR